MPRCQYTDICIFFTDEIGYSIDLQAAMRIEYCMGDFESCARFQAMPYLQPEEIPDDLIPTDHARVAELIDAKRDK
jgi:hypothetical protein